MSSVTPTIKISLQDYEELKRQADVFKDAKFLYRNPSRGIYLQSLTESEAIDVLQKHIETLKADKKSLTSMYEQDCRELSNYKHYLEIKEGYVKQLQQEIFDHEQRIEKLLSRNLFQRIFNISLSTPKGS